MDGAIEDYTELMRQRPDISVQGFLARASARGKNGEGSAPCTTSLVTFYACSKLDTVQPRAGGQRLR